MRVPLSRGFLNWGKSGLQLKTRLYKIVITTTTNSAYKHLYLYLSPIEMVRICFYLSLGHGFQDATLNWFVFSKSLTKRTGIQ